MLHIEPDQLINQAKNQRENMLALLKRMVEIESPSSEPEAQIKLKHLISHELEKLGFDTRWLSGVKSGGHIYARPKKWKKHLQTQLIIGHIDTVWPLGTLQTMPFLVNGNTVKGPGVFDMKGGIVQLIAALNVLNALEYRPTIMPLIFLNSDEEVGSHESTHFIHRLAKISDRAFVLEPAMGEKGALKTRRKGVGRFSVRVEGKAAHAGLDPTAGASAILELSHVIQKLFALNDPDKGVSVNVGVIDGGIRPNVIAPVSTASVDVRVLNSVDIPQIEKVICSIQSETDGVMVKISGKIGRPPLEKTRRNDVLWHYAKDCADKLQIEISQATAGGGSDGCTTSQFTATLDGLGAVGDGAHADHEFLSMDKSIERVALLSMLIMAPSLKRE